MRANRDDAGGQDQRHRCSCTSLRKASRRISQLYDVALAPCGLKTTQRAILGELRRSEPATLGQLAAALVMDAGALAHTLKPLERDGYLAIGIDPNDRRARLIRLTPIGQAKLIESDALWEQAQHRFDSLFGAAQSESLRAALTILISGEFAAGFEVSLS
ncbi:winged helix-turn-helix transcriptional regulator [Acidisoma cellulosilytica]|uniref:Winged helix-turn-helix transcriptional regulator n=1 Tax=Acidisoma cellulosilyticum TaxID=2802395 RepID=A0A963Z4R6_9PROT|nr:MarR family winged helix-turn-helix transcriptional regulator [Acidisoma cellulosilyticum]MCB8882799.1 winged helix-turn-helix transcriptional regulator [Acidisoma cellulosilyticum]